MPVSPNLTNALLDNRLEAIRGAQADAFQTKAELDISGGIDSAVMACLLVMALGPENVTLVHSRFSTNPAQTKRAVDLGEALGCPVVDAALGGMWEVLLDEMKRSLLAAGYDMDEIEARIEADPTILGSIRSCLRAPIGRGYNRLTGGGLRYGTGNECEDRLLRFYQKGGDGEVDNNPLVMLSKGEVYQLAWFIAQRAKGTALANVMADPDPPTPLYDVLIETIKAMPSPDLWGTGDGHNDEDELLSWTGAPFTYSRIDIETGQYSYVGSIERVARFLDMPFSQDPDDEFTLIEDYLFDDFIDVNEVLMVTLAKRSGHFDGGEPHEFSRSRVETLLLAARKAEKITRHKYNPNCPSYGSREELVQAGILTNSLPVITG